VLASIDNGVYVALIALYGLLAVTHVFRRNGIPPLSWGVLALHTGLIILRWVEVGRTPFSSLYECLSLFAWAGALAYLLVQRFGREKVRWSGVVLFVLMAAAMAYGSTKDPAVKPLSPALDSVWFEIHVIPAFASYALFVAAFAYMFEFLVTAARHERLQEFSRKLILFGFPLLTFGTLSGAGWAEETWGTYWSWDPKETASLVTWSVYLAYIHAARSPRFCRGPARVLNVLGFVSMMFTFLGFNLLAKLLGLPTAHAYT
jgi:ABC-type transport system involved in cytochrome c biogenesis permease subunit